MFDEFSLVHSRLVSLAFTIHPAALRSESPHKHDQGEYHGETR